MKRIRVWALVLLGCMMLAVLAGCTDQSKLEEAYRDAVSATVETINADNKAFSTALKAFFQDLSEENRTAVLQAADALKASYDALGALKAPEKYASVQAEYRAGADAVMQALEIYKAEFATVKEQTFNEAFVERLKPGDEQMSAGSQKIVKATETLQEIGE